MKLVKAVLEIKYAKPASQFTFLNGLVSSLGSSLPQCQELVIGAGAEIRLKNQKILVRVDTNMAAVVIEEDMTPDQMKNKLLDLIQKINRQLSWSVVSRIGVRTFWTKETDNLTAAISKFKNSFYKESSLVTNASDIALCLTLKDEDKTINFNAGPMAKEQLLQYITFKENHNYPNFLYFADIDYYQIVGNRNYSKNSINDFVQKGLNFASTKAEETFNALI